MQTKLFFQAVLSLSLALALSARTVYSTNKSFTLESTGQAMSATGTAKRYDANGNRWGICQSRQLNALIVQVLENNIDLKQVVISVDKALYQVNILGADLVPSFSGSLSAPTSRNLKTGSHGNAFGSQLGLSYKPNLWRKFSATADAQVWEYQIARQDMVDTCPVLIDNVADAYFNTVYLNEAIELTQKSLKQYQEIDRIVDARLRYGRADSSQPIQTKQPLLSVQNNLIPLKSSLDAQEQVLRNLLDLKSNEAIAADPAQYRLLPVKDMNLNVSTTVLANHPDLCVAEYRPQSLLQFVKI